MASSLSPLVQKTATLLALDEEVVKDVVSYSFAFLRNFFRNPDKLGVRFTYLGSWRARRFKVDKSLRIVLSQLRENRTPELVEEFRALWKLRKITKVYESKRNYRRFHEKYDSFRQQSFNKVTGS